MYCILFYRCFYILFCFCFVLFENFMENVTFYGKFSLCHIHVFNVILHVSEGISKTVLQLLQCNLEGYFTPKAKFCH